MKYMLSVVAFALLALGHFSAQETTPAAHANPPATIAVRHVAAPPLSPKHVARIPSPHAANPTAACTTVSMDCLAIAWNYVLDDVMPGIKARLE